MQKNPDFRFNRMRKSGKTEFFEVHIKRAVITQLENSVVRHIPHFFSGIRKVRFIIALGLLPIIHLLGPEFLRRKEPLIFHFELPIRFRVIFSALFPRFCKGLAKIFSQVPQVGLQMIIIK